MDIDPEDARAAGQLAELALDRLGRTPDRRRRRALVRRLSGGLDCQGVVSSGSVGGQPAHVTAG